MRLFRSSSAGFTLIELLVATVLTVALAGLLVAIVTNALSIWSSSSGKLRTASQARAILDQLTLDFQSMPLRRDGRVWMAATVQQIQNMPRGDSGATDADWTGPIKPADSQSLALPASGSNIPSLDQYRFGQGGMWVRLFSDVPDNYPDLVDEDGDNDRAEVLLQRVSAVRAISWQIVRRRLPSDVREFGYGLYRAEVIPAHADSTIQAKTTFAIGYDLFAENGYNDPVIGGVGAGEAGTIRQPLRSQLIGTGVIDFGVRVWSRNASGVLEVRFPTGPSNLGFAATSRMPGTAGTLPPTPPGRISAAQMSYGMPEEIELFIRLLTEEGQNLIRAMEQGAPSSLPEATWWDVAEKHSVVFTRRIRLPQQSL